MRIAMGGTGCNAYSCARGASALVIVTEWAEFRALDLGRLKREMAKPVIVDLRNIYRPDEMARLGFTYDSIGRTTVHHNVIPAIVADKYQMDQSHQR